MKGLLKNQLAMVKNYPNPFSVETNFEIKGVEIEEGVFKLFDATGRLLRVQNFDKKTFANGNIFFHHRK